MILAFRCDPALTALFAPADPRAGQYEICTTPEPFDRTRLRRLFNGRRVAVVRGWRRAGDSLESVTLISPYPDASLTSVRDGTMMIRSLRPIAAPR